MMTRAAYRWFHAAHAVAAVSGLVLAVMKYLMDPVDPYAVIHHPWQSHVLHIHVVSAPLLVLMIGYFWSAHALINLQAGTQSGRATGLGLLITALPMIVSGVLIQAAVEPAMRTCWVVVHVTASLLWLSAWIFHCLRARIHRRA